MRKQSFLELEPLVCKHIHDARVTDKMHIASTDVEATVMLVLNIKQE